MAALNADLFNDGFTNVTGIDFSKVVIERMQEKHGKKYPALVCKLEKRQRK